MSVLRHKRTWESVIQKNCEAILIAHVAAGFAVLARLAAIPVATMYAIFGLLVHLPLAIQEPYNPRDWK